MKENGLFCCYLFNHYIMPNSFATPGTVVHQAPLAKDFQTENAGVVCHFRLRGGSSDPRIEPHVSYIAGTYFTTEPPRKPQNGLSYIKVKEMRKTARSY